MDKIDTICKEPGDQAFLQMTHHEVAHAIVSRLVGVPVAHFKVSQWSSVNELDALFGGCSFCNNVPESFSGAHWHEKALIKRAGHIGETRHCATAGREPTVPSDDDKQLELLFRKHARRGEPTNEGKEEFDQFVQALDTRITEWFNAPDISATFEGLVRLVIEQRIDQGDNYYACEFAGTAVEDAMADLPTARQSFIDWP